MNKEFDDLEDALQDRLKNMDNMQIKADEEKRKFRRLRECGYALFSTKLGEEFLELLKEQFLLKPVSPAGYTERASCVREGHNEVIRLLINIAKKELGVKHESRNTNNK